MVSESMIRTSRKVTVIQVISNLKCESGSGLQHAKRQGRGHAGRRSKSSQKKLSNPQLEQADRDPKAPNSVVQRAYSAAR